MVALVGVVGAFFLPSSLFPMFLKFTLSTTMDQNIPFYSISKEEHSQ